MSDRTTETQITFSHPFQLSPLVKPLAPGTYRIITDEEVIPGIPFIAYRRSSTMLHIPAIGVLGNTEQYISVDPKELEAVRLKDVETH
ncbi:hypothetical protein JJB09_26175 [Rhizobium sp. KVB221]|uniref:Uncharacterized protein n=1 Tax=Rhizobium setariae TaxID=2801340 RepID=A0A936YV53_9HYPH|nr:hypothetical protein [Rhizobium setariae]MBL0375499.1 hypothetical protein [Rhizobium setariae]